ncbi:MAG: hypothetical protein ABL999_16905 [Pyrinomonadaceae bacterium]
MKTTFMAITLVLSSTLSSVGQAALNLNDATSAIKKGEIAKAREIVKSIGLAEYDAKVFEVRAGLLAGGREYKEAVTLINRVLEDQAISPDERKTLERLKEYCIEKLGEPNSVEEAHVCRFCHAKISANTAYCPVCLQFQHSISEIKTKNGRTKFTYNDSKSLDSVNYYYENRHTGMKMFAIGLAVASVAAGTYTGVAGSVPVILQDPDKITKEFNFTYDQSVPRGIDFKAEAEKGGSTTSMIATSGIGDIAIGQTDRKESGVAKKLSQMNIIYGNNPSIDPIALKIAFGINLSHVFYQSEFDPFLWKEPHIFSANYSNEGRLVSAVDIYRYQRDGIGKYSFTTGYAFQNPYDILHSEADVQWVFGYNDDGQLNTIKQLRNGNDVNLKTITYENGLIKSEIETSRRFKIDQLRERLRAAEWELEYEVKKSIEKAENEKKQAEKAAKYRAKVQKARLNLENGLKEIKFEKVDEIKYVWTPNTNSAPPKLIRAEGDGLTVIFQ